MLSLPLHIAINILSFFPAKTLAHFKCVSDSPHFIDLHLAHSVETNMVETFLSNTISALMVDQRSQHLGWIEHLLNMLEGMDWSTKDLIQF